MLFLCPFLGGDNLSDKYLKEIAKELRIIRLELQNQNKPDNVQVGLSDALSNIVDNEEKKKRAQERFAGERVTID